MSTTAWLQDPPPEDGELGYTAPLEGSTGLEDVLSHEPEPAQVTMEELLEEESKTGEELGLAEPYPLWEP